ncbi:MAG: DUF1574 family protein [Gemmataceae bacterium]
MTSTSAVPTVAPRTRRQTARNTLLAAVLILLVTHLGFGQLTEHDLRYRDPFYGDKLSKLRTLQAQHPGHATVLALGTSRTGFAFHAAAIQQQLNSKPPAIVFNFGIPASGPLTHRIYLERLLRDGIVPDLLLLEVMPSMMTMHPAGPLESLWVFPERFTPAEAQTLEALGYPAGTVQRARTTTLNPVHVLRQPLLGRLAPSWLPWHQRYDASRSTDPHGWSSFPRDQITPEELAFGRGRAAEEYAAVLGAWQLNPATQTAWADLLQIARGRGIPVVFLWMPEGPSFQAHYNPTVRPALLKIIHDLGAPLIDARDWVPEELTTDGHHLLRPGAERFTEKILPDLRKQLSPRGAR